MKTGVLTSLIASCVTCAALMCVGILFCDKLLEAIDTPKAVFADSKLYLDIYGLPAVFLYNVATGIRVAWPIGWTVSMVLSVVLYSSIRWTRTESPALA